jgi:hypothetical protein
MARDARLQGPAFGKLAMLLAKSLRDETRIRSIAISLDVEGLVNWDGDARDQWTSLINVAADRPAVLEQLLQEIDDYLKGTRYHEEFLKWRNQNVQDGQGRLDRAVSDVRKSRNSLLAINDPRKGQLYIRAMRSSIMEIKEIIEAVPDKVPSDRLILAAAAEELAAARSEILFACEDALREVDQLMIDIAEARRQSARARQEYSGQEAFAAERSMVRLLLNDRGLVDLESQALLEVIDQQLAHLGIPVRESDLQGQAPPQRAEP